MVREVNISKILFIVICSCVLDKNVGEVSEGIDYIFYFVFLFFCFLFFVKHCNMVLLFE